MSIKRKRVLDAIAHKQTDIVPWNFELTPGAVENIQKLTGYEDAFNFLGNHMLRVKYKKNTKLANGNEKDIFGVEWMAAEDGGDVGIIAEYPLEEDEFGDYQFPQIHKEFASAVCDQLEADQKDHYTMFSITMGYFERSWSLRGMENILVDMIINEEFSFQIYENILNHHLELLDTVLDRDFDAVYFGDDWGQQRGSIMGPAMWRKYIKPGFKEMFDKVKSKGKQIVLHSCGDIEAFFPDLIEMGLDVYNTMQPEIYDLKKIKQEYGRDLTFYGGISTQQFLPFASVEETREKTKEILDIMYRDGGYILSPTHTATPDIPAENLLAMIEVAKSVTIK